MPFLTAYRFSKNIKVEENNSKTLSKSSLRSSESGGEVERRDSELDRGFLESKEGEFKEVSVRVSKM